MSDIFISYARSTEKHARKVADELASLGYGVWRDDALPAHQAYAEVIQERLEAAKAVLVLWSADAVKSQWVRSEANRGRQESKLVQARLDASAPPMPFDQIQCADLSGWTGEEADPGWRKVVASVAVLTEIEPGPPPPKPTGPPRIRPPTKGMARRWPIFAMLALILIAVLGAWTVLHKATNPGRSLRSVAVLPIRNLTGDPGADAAADRITEDLIDVLGRSGDVVVASRDTVFALKGKSVDARALGKALGVRTIITSSLRKSPPSYLVSFQMVDTQNGQVTDSNEVAATSSDGSAPENRLVLSLFNALAPGIERRWRAYELGRPANDKDPENLTARMARLADDGGRKDIPEFERILAAARTTIPKDSDLRPSVDRLACDYLQDLLGGGLYRTGAERAAWADQALALGAEEGALRPNSTSPHVCRSAAFGALERWDEGMTEAQYIIDTYPVTANGYVARANLEFARGQFASALKDYAEVAESARGDPVDIGSTKLFLGDYGPAIVALRQAAVLSPRDSSAPFYLTAALQLSGNHADALVAAQTYRRLKTDDSVWQNLALSHEPAFLARAAIIRQGLRDAGLEQTPARS